MRRIETGTELHAFRLEWLPSFLALIASGGHQANAAKSLGCTATALHRNVRDLEAWLRKPLFTVDKELTSFGKVFEETARTILGLLKEAQYIPPQPEPKKPISAAQIDMSRYKTKKDDAP
jgi:DNA-binding transcriptional LysR family regulator